jgi:hypothetical protein
MTQNEKDNLLFIIMGWLCFVILISAANLIVAIGKAIFS